MENQKYNDTEDKIAKKFFGKIENLHMSVSRLIYKISKISDEVNYNKSWDNDIEIDANLDNIGITLNNKLVEIYQQFKERNIEVFSEDDKQDIEISLLPGIVFKYLIDKTSHKSISYLNEYIIKQGLLENKKWERYNRISKKGFIGERIWNLRVAFNPDVSTELFYSDEEIKELQQYLDDYKKEDKKIWSFDLKRDFKDCLEYFFVDNHASKEEREEIVEYLKDKLEEMEMMDEIPEIESLIDESDNSEENKPWKLTPMQKYTLKNNSQTSRHINTEQQKGKESEER